MKKKILLLALFMLLGSRHSLIQAQCKAENLAFTAGEELTYKLYFNWKFIWFTVGSASMTINQTDYEGKEAYQCDLITRGNKRADRFFVLRDTLVNVFNHELVPYYYRKGALEGDRYTVDEAWYSYPNGKDTFVKQKFLNHRKQLRTRDSLSVECVYDMLSMMCRARSFDASDYQVGQKILFPMADRGRISQQTLIYRGLETFKMESTGTKYRCMVFSFVEYEEGKEQEVITFYITDDKNHLPVRLDMYLRFGSAKAFLTDMKGIRNPQTSIIE